jgi:cell filamentation protein
MHRYLFEDIYDWAGSTRVINIEKPEQVLAGLSVDYSPHEFINIELGVILTVMQKTDWSKYSLEEKAEVFSHHIKRLWKIHPFREGNTRTITHFYCQYYDSQNEQINRKLFEQNAKYFRTALVAANAEIDGIGDKSDISYLCRIVLDAVKR